MTISKEQYENTRQKQKAHRIFNTFLGVLGIVMFLLMLRPVTQSVNQLYEDVSGITEVNIYNSELLQIVKDEGYKNRVYTDSLGKQTIGFGHLVKDGEVFTNGLDARDAITLLKEDYSKALSCVDTNYPWAEDEIRLVLGNMTYQLGCTGVSKFKLTLSHLKDKDYEEAAIEMLNSRWAAQTPNRASRLAARILQLEEQ